MIYDTTKERFLHLTDVPSESDANCKFGIRSFRSNPSRTILATVKENPCSIALYELPSLTPIEFYDDFSDSKIFDLCWLSDCRLAIARRGGEVNIYNFEYMIDQDKPASSEPLYQRNKVEETTLKILSQKMETHKLCPNICAFNDHLPLKARALAFNGISTLFILDSGGHIYSYDIVSQSFNWQMLLPGLHDNTCLAFSSKLKILAAGSPSCIYFLEDNSDYPRVTLVSYLKE